MRSPRGEPPQSVPAASRLTVRSKKNRRRPASLWSRLPPPRSIGDACGRALRRSLPLIAVAGAAGAAIGAAWLGYAFITGSPRFAITEIQVHGNHRLSGDAVRAALPVRPGDNLFTADLDDAAAALRAHPWIAAAEARRILPRTLVVDVREHEPAAVVALGELYLVDAAGHPFKRAELAAGDGADLPVVTGLPREAYQRDPAATAAAVTGALAVLAAWRADPARPAIGELHLDDHGGLTLRTYDHAAAIQLGRVAGPAGPQLAARMQTFDAAWGELSEPERLRARAIHLHDDARPDQVTVAFAKD